MMWQDAQMTQYIGVIPDYVMMVLWVKKELNIVVG